MALLYDPRYYTLNKIPNYRLKYIKVKVKEFMKEFNLKFPCVDFVNLLGTINSINGTALLKSSVKEISNNFDALARYYPSDNVFIIILNRNKIKYPFRYSKDRRLNFTLGHELGHIMLGHLAIPSELKTPEEKEIEEYEADEFAAQVLMPENLILSANFISPIEVANYFNVSSQAIWKRLNNLKKLYLLKSTPILTCQICGNKEISPYAYYCKICGESLIDNTRGIYTMIYNDGFETNKNGKVIYCPICSNEKHNENAQYCIICGSGIYNYCIQHFNDYGECNHINPGNARFCEMCGKPTYFGTENYLSSWKDAKMSIEEAAATEEQVDEEIQEYDDLPF